MSSRIEYTALNALRSEALSKELGHSEIAVTEKGLYRLFHNDLPHYFIRLNDAIEFLAFITKGVRHDN